MRIYITTDDNTLVVHTMVDYYYKFDKTAICNNIIFYTMA